MIKEKDDRWAKQFGDFAEDLVMYIMGQMKNMSVALIDHVGADLIATQRKTNGMRFAISVKGRNFPSSESKSFGFSQGNIDKLQDTSETFGLIPAVAFVFVDDMEGSKKIRVFISKLADLFTLCEDPMVDFINYSTDGITFKYTESNRVHHLSAIKNCQLIDYSELVFSHLSNDISFLEES